jgi:hypothetical protein
MKKLNELLFFVAIFVISFCVFLLYSIDIVDRIIEPVHLTGYQILSLSFITSVFFYLLFNINEKLK